MGVRANENGGVGGRGCGGLHEIRSYSCLHNPPCVCTEPIGSNYYRRVRVYFILHTEKEITDVL